MEAFSDGRQNRLRLWQAGFESSERQMQRTGSEAFPAGSIAGCHNTKDSTAYQSSLLARQGLIPNLCMCHSMPVNRYLRNPEAQGGEHSDNGDRSGRFRHTVRRPVSFIGRFNVDADGSPDARSIDPCGNEKTSLQFKNGEYVNSTKIPYVALPIGMDRMLGVKLGDMFLVTNYQEYNEGSQTHRHRNRTDRRENLFRVFEQLLYHAAYQDPSAHMLWQRIGNMIRAHRHNHGHQSLELKPLLEKTSPPEGSREFVENHVRNAKAVANRMQSKGLCARGLRLALEASGIRVERSNAWQMRHQIADSGKFVEIPQSEAQEGDIGFRRWTGSPNGAGHCFTVVAKDWRGHLIEASDHITRFKPNNPRYDKTVFYRRVV